MDELLVMHVLDGHEGLVEKLEGFDLAESPMLVQIVEQVALLSILYDDVYFLLILEQIVELDDVFVTQVTMDKHLSPEVFLIDLLVLLPYMDLGVRSVSGGWWWWWYLFESV